VDLAVKAQETVPNLVSKKFIEDYIYIYIFNPGGPGGPHP
jgi:hypothetical protein